VPAVLVLEHRARLPQRRERVGAQLEADDTRANLGIGRILRQVSRPMSRDQLFDLAQVLLPRSNDPFGLGPTRRDAGQLADR
jgi:hypothetical protein